MNQPVSDLHSKERVDGGANVVSSSASSEEALTKSSRRRLDVQGLRGVAVLLVVMFHADLPVPGGFTGVDVFYVISGFVITGVLLADLTGSGRLRLRRFYARRVKRLLPALAVVLTFVAVVGVLASPAGAQRTGALTGAFASVFSANVYLYRLGTGYFDVSTSLNPLLHTWTLAVEEQFYLVFPVLLLVSWRATRRMTENGKRVTAAAVIGAVSAISFLISLILSSGHTIAGIGWPPERLAFYGSPTRAWEFGAGAILALLAPWATRISARHAEVLAVAGVASVAVGALAIKGTEHFPGTAALLPVGGTSALLLAGTASRGRVSRLLSRRPIAWIGDLSYSWYLWHWPLIVFAGALWPGVSAAPRAAAAVSLIPAWASYRYVENPIRFSPRVRGRAVLALAAICVAVPLAANAGLLGAQEAISGTTAMKSWERSQLQHVDELRRCDSPIPLAERTGVECTWRVPGSRGRVVLVGDSNAGHFTEPVVAAAKRARLDATVATFSGCPFVDARVIGTLPGEGPCRRFYERTLAELLEHPPTLVVAAALTSGYIEKHEIKLRTSTGHATANAQAKANLWREALRSTLTRLNKAGVAVIVVHPVPTFPYTPNQCAVLRVLARSCESSLSRGEVARNQRRAVDTEIAAVGDVARSYTLDFTNQVCGERRCSTMRGPMIMYRNTNHLTVDGALTLTDRFYAAMMARAR